MTTPFWKRVSAEAVGTFALVFAGTAAIVVNDVSGGAVTHVGIALTFGLWAARRFPTRLVVPYVAAQLLGAVGASILLAALFPDHSTLGGTRPSGSDRQSLVFEAVLTSGLVLVILCVSVGDGVKRITAGLAIGSVIALEALFAGPVSGASMNPARSFAPAFVAWQWGSLWVYLLGPVAGAVLAVPVCRAVREPGCCGRTSLCPTG